MKNKIPVIFAILLLFQSAGYFIVFEIRQAIIHEVVKEKIENNVPESELVIFKVPFKEDKQTNSDLQRINKKEFRFNGQMYDIVRMKQCNDSIWYYCISDEKETVLFSNLDKIIKQQQDTNPNHKNQQKQQERFFSLLYDLQFIGYSQLFFGKHKLFYPYKADMVCFLGDTAKPPPKNKLFT